MFFSQGSSKKVEEKLLVSSDPITEKVVSYSTETGKLSTGEFWRTDSQAKCFKMAGNKKAVLGKDTIYVDEKALSLKGVIWCDWYPYNSDFLVCMTKDGCIHILKEDRKLCSAGKVSVPMTTSVVSACFGFNKTQERFSWCSLTLFVLFENGDVVFLTPFLLAPMRLPVQIALSLEKDTMGRRLMDFELDGEDLVIEELPSPWNRLQPCTQGPTLILPEPAPTSKSAREVHFVPGEHHDTLVLVFAGGRIDMLAILDPIKSAFMTTKQLILHSPTLYLLDSIAFEPEVTHFACVRGMFWVRDVKKTVWQVEVKDEGVIKNIAEASTYLSLCQKDGEPCLDLGEKIISIPHFESNSKGELIHVEPQLWKQLPELKTSEPTPIPKELQPLFVKSILPEGIDEDALDAFCSQLRVWRSNCISPLLRSLSILGSHTQMLLQASIQIERQYGQAEKRLFGERTIRGAFTDTAIQRIDDLRQEIEKLEKNAEISNKITWLESMVEDEKLKLAYGVGLLSTLIQDLDIKKSK